MVDYQPKTSIRNLPMLLQKVSVMIVDPDMRIANIVKHVLLNLGFGTIHMEQTSRSAIERLKTDQVDFIITEYDPVPVDGENLFIKHIRTSPDSPNPTVPIIMLTGHTLQDDVKNARDMGITEFASKPFTAKGLCDRIVRIIENPRSFIITKRYAGPDRRRRDGPAGEGERRTNPETSPEKMELFDQKSKGFLDRLLGKKS